MNVAVNEAAWKLWPSATCASPLDAGTSHTTSAVDSTVAADGELPKTHVLSDVICSASPRFVPETNARPPPSAPRPGRS